MKFSVDALRNWFGPSAAIESPTRAIEFETVARHNTAIIEGSGPLSITTPAEQWAYAAEFSLPDLDSFGDYLEVKVEAELNEGSVGVGCLDKDGALLTESFFSQPKVTETVRLVVSREQGCQSLIIRNVASGRRSQISILGITLGRADTGQLRETTVVVNDDSLHKFVPWSGIAAAGYFVDWLGAKTRTEVWAFDSTVKAIYDNERYESSSVPMNEDILNWVPLIDSVVAAGDVFVMVSLGSGWGRWLVSGAFAAQQLGRDYRLAGVEAEPKHFEWMVRHFEENGLDPKRYTLVHAAISSEEGDCWFRIGNSASWYGQSILPDVQLEAGTSEGAAIGSEVSVGDESLRRVRCVDFKSIARDLPVIDYVHMDVQGAEADVLTACPEILQERVRMVNIGTHSPEIEHTLRRMFSELGWRSRYDIPLKTSAVVKMRNAEGKRIEFGDGVQVWTNPRLTPSR